MNTVNYHLAYNLAEAVMVSPDGETPEEIFDRWYSDPSPTVQVGQTLIQPVTMTETDKAEVIAKITEIVDSR